MKEISRLARAIAATQQRDPIIHAFAFRPESYQQALPGRPLSGLPIAVKDLIDTKDMPTAYGCALFKDNYPQEDAWIVTQLKTAGAIIFGKTTTTEFAWRHAPSTGL